MLTAILIIPVITIITGIALYKHSGSKEFFRMDLVQFIYSFVLMPVMYVWLKTFLFVLLTETPELMISIRDVYVIDTIFTLAFIFFFGINVIHSLTKSFELKKINDPLTDIFELSEYFHRDFSHNILYLGAMCLLAGLAILNLIFPMSLGSGKFILYVSLLSGAFTGLVVYAVILNYHSGKKFLKLMRLSSGMLFTFLVITYFIVRPNFSSVHLFFWYTLLTFTSLVLNANFLFRYKKFKSLLGYFLIEDRR